MDENNKTQFRFRWSSVVLLALVFVGIIVLRLSNTIMTIKAIKANTGKPVVCLPIAPAETEANELESLHEIESLPLEQEQDLPAVVMEAAPRIEAICISGSGKSGIFVRGDFAYEGDVVDGFRILKIYPDKVEFEKDGKTVTGVFPPP